MKFIKALLLVFRPNLVKQALKNLKEIIENFLFGFEDYDIEFM